MTCLQSSELMDPSLQLFSESATSHNSTSSLHDSDARFGKAILAVHSGGNNRRSGFLEADLSNNSFSEDGGTSGMDASGSSAYTDGDDFTAASHEQGDGSDYFSESATESLEASVAAASSSKLLASHPVKHSKKKVKRKKVRAKQGSGLTKAGTEDGEDAPNNKTTKTSSKGATSKQTVKRVKKRASSKKKGENKPSDYEWWHTSTINAGSTMEDFSAYSNTEGETDNEHATARRAARRKKKPPVESQEEQRPKSRSPSRTRNDEPQDVETTQKSKRKSRVVKKKSGDSTSTGKKAPRVSSKKKANNEEDLPAHSFGEDTYTRNQLDDDDSIAMESLFDISRQNMLLGQEPQSATSVEKEASLDLAKHTPALLPPNNNNTTKKNHKNRAMMDALTKGNNMSVSTLQTTVSLDVTRTTTSTTTTKKLQQRRKTIDNTVSKPTTTATKKPKPRRIKSHDTTPALPNTKTDPTTTKANNNKPIRRTKSYGDDGPRLQTRIPSKTRRPPKKKQPRSQSLNHLAGVTTNNTNNTTSTSRNNNIRRRRLHASETSPTGNSKMSLSVSGAGNMLMNDTSATSNAMTVQSMPLLHVRRGSTGMPHKAKSHHESISKLQMSSTLGTTTRNTSNNKKGVNNKRASSKDRKKKPLKRKESQQQQKSGGEKVTSSLEEDDSIRSMEGMLLSGHIAKESQGRSADEFSKSEASTIISTSTGASGRVSAGSTSSTNKRTSLRNKSSNLRASGNLRASNTGSSHHDTMIHAYFGSRDNEGGGTTDTEKGGPSGSFSDSMEGSLLSDYSSDGERCRSGELARSMTISPFSAHAAHVTSHTKASSSMLTTEHTSSPLIPDSDDDESVSFHVPQPISSEVKDAPPTPVADTKASVPPAVDTSSTPAADTTEQEQAKAKEVVKKEPPPAEEKESAKNEVGVQGPVNVIMGPVLDANKKEVSKTKPVPKLDDLDDDDPVPPRPSQIVAKPTTPKPSLWETLCCRSASAVAQ
ncbi:expressed unknown protein [Seminavis robusta]|uniref:Uncharacterized protein n=1 Tax=Seminavis robusta TaxID=568900 RepID=A0A9N8HPA1_9STRA|nr:expressed unknown protein [Seminavis robusta]|eukprot:Sro1067_g237380.1 n/a (991) ;mRNA; f:11516-14488